MWKELITPDGGKTIHGRINTLEHFYEFLKCLSTDSDKNRRSIFIFPNHENKEIFEFLTPLLKSEFSNSQIEQWKDHGCILFNKHRVACCFRFGLNNRRMKFHQLHVEVSKV